MDIELLRGIAVLGVVFHHLQGSLFRDGLAWLGSVAAYGQFWWGVDLFFAISGFVIARSLIPQLRACTSGAQCWQRIRDFWIRRAFRLLPSAWLWLLLMLLASLFLNRSGAFGSLHANLWATVAGLLQFANFRFADSFSTMSTAPVSSTGACRWRSSSTCCCRCWCCCAASTWPGRCWRWYSCKS